MLTVWVYYSFLFTLMLWSMTLLAKFFYTNSYFVVKLKFYECGFKPVKSNYVFYDINFTLMLLFLLVYDLELAVLLPYTLVFTKGSLVAFGVIFLFFVLLVLTMIIDVRYLSLDWQAR